MARAPALCRVRGAGPGSRLRLLSASQGSSRPLRLPLMRDRGRAPSILILLTLGFGAGAIGALDPNALLGEAVVSATVSIAVGVILFESGLDLKVSELEGGCRPRLPAARNAGDPRDLGDRHCGRLSALRSVLGGRAGSRGGARRLRADGGRTAARVHSSLEDGPQGPEVGGDACRSDRWTLGVVVFLAWRRAGSWPRRPRPPLPSGLTTMGPPRGPSRGA